MFEEPLRALAGFWCPLHLKLDNISYFRPGIRGQSGGLGSLVDEEKDSSKDKDLKVYRTLADLLY